jgi:two-component system, chemotaxis family, chemotaxis protein CheY
MKKKLLVVDDAVSMLLLLKKFFEINYEVVTYKSVNEAIQYLQNNMELPDLIISDLNMGDVSGEDFVRYLKSEMITKDIPTFILTSNEQSSVRVKFLKLGVDDILIKPFNFEELSLRVDNILKRYSVFK